jgi:hypothetical protein
MVYVFASTFSLNLFSKTTTPTKFILLTNVAWVRAYRFCVACVHLIKVLYFDEVHTGHIKCQNVPKKNFFKFSSPEPKVVQKMKTFLEGKAKGVLHFVCVPHLLTAYTFAVAALRMLRYENLTF